MGLQFIRGWGGLGQGGGWEQRGRLGEPQLGEHDWVSDDWVDWGWLVSWSRVSDTLVLDISNIATIAGSVSVVVHNLDAAVGKGHPVVASHSGTIRSLVLAEVGAGVLVLNAVLKGIWLGWLSVAGSRGVDGDWAHRGMHDGGGVHDGGSVHKGGGDDVGGHFGCWLLLSVELLV